MAACIPPPPATFAARDLTDDDWSLRTVHAGDGTVEVTLTLCRSARRRQTRQFLALACVAALALFAAPLPAGGAAAWEWLCGAAAAALPLPAAARAWARAVPAWARALAPLAAAAGLRLAALAALLAALPQPVVQESVLALRGLGVQVKTVRRGGAAACRFVDAGSVRALVVNEGFQACDVRYYLALVLARRGRLMLLFDHARPRLPALASAYRALLPALFPDATAAAAHRYVDRVLDE